MDILKTLLLFYFGTLHLSRGNDIVLRNHVWRNLKEFSDFGWKEAFRGVTKSYASPREMDPNLEGLVGTNVWGIKRTDLPTSGSTQSYTLNLDVSEKPEFCGLINATLFMRYHLVGNSDSQGSSIYPACTTGSSPGVCMLSNSDFATWSTVLQEIVLSQSKVIDLRISFQNSGTPLFLIDEVRLISAAQHGDQCPISCGDDCDYRGIDCHNYYTCVDRRYKDIRSCEKSKGLAFNPATKSCDLIQNVVGCSDTVPQCVCEFRPHESNCSLYYYCHDTCNVEGCEQRQCPGGLYWSVDARGDGSGQQQCVPRGEAVCFNRTQ